MSNEREGELIEKPKPNNRIKKTLEIYIKEKILQSNKENNFLCDTKNKGIRDIKIKVK